MDKKLVAIVVGHSRERPGAKPMGGRSEWETLKVVADAIIEQIHSAAPHLDVLRVLRHDQMPTYEAHCRLAANMIDAVYPDRQPDYLIELHYNSVGQRNPLYNATFAYIPGIGPYPHIGPQNPEEARIAGAITQAISEKFGFDDRGARTINRSWAKAENHDGMWIPKGPSFLHLYDIAPVAFILECFNGANPEHAAHFTGLNSNRSELGWTIADAFIKAIGGDDDVPNA